MAELYTVTGGCGFIGGHLVRALRAAGHKVRVLDDLSTGHREVLPAGVALIEGDVADPAAMAAASEGASGIFHLAAVASVERCNREYRTAHRTNLGGTVTVFETARDAGCIPVTWASSAAVYGAADEMPIGEDAPKGPLSPYGADKLGGELHAAAAANVFGLPSTALRFFNVYGPGQDPASPYSGVISIFADRMARGRDVTIYGDGGQSRDFIYVADVVRGLMAAMDRMHRATAPRFDAINLCTGRETTVGELALLVKRLLDAPGAIEHAAARTGDIRRSIGDPTRMKGLLGIEAGTALETGLVALLEHDAPVLASA